MADEPTIGTQKRRLRRAIVQKIAAMAPGQRQDEEHRLLERFPTLPGLDQAGTILLYVAVFPEEIPTRSLLAWALREGRRVACPCVDRERGHLRLHLVSNPKTDLVPGALGIPEPSALCPELMPTDIDWSLVPGLGFDPRGYRLGRGGGYYDRLLPRLRSSTPRWALALSPQCVAAVPREPHDQPLDGVLAPDGTWANLIRSGPFFG